VKQEELADIEKVKGLLRQWNKRLEEMKKQSYAYMDDGEVGMANGAEWELEQCIEDLEEIFKKSNKYWLWSDKK